MDLINEWEGEWAGIIGAMDNPMIPGGSVASSIFLTVPETTGAAIVASTPGQVFLNSGAAIANAPTTATNALSAITPAHSTLIIYIVLIIAVLLLVGKVEAL